jgi:hypothetical protein
MSKYQTCHRCGAVLLPDAEVCSTCCAPQSELTAQPPSEPAGAAVPQTDPSASSAPSAPSEPATVQSRLAAWPFGQVDAEAAAEAASRAQHGPTAPARDLSGELARYTTESHPATAQNSTHMLTAIPSQRAAEPVAEMESVPSVGPNPFLSAARVQHARDEVTAVEGYPV